MRDFLCELKLPAVLISVVTIVWCTALRSSREQEYYHPPDEQFTHLQDEMQKSQKAEADDATVRLELNP